MKVNLSIKGVPEEVAQRLRERAQRHHRSLQGELMAIIEAAASGMAATSDVPPPPYRVPAAPAAEDLLDRIDAELRGAGLAGGPWLSREAVHDRVLQRESGDAGSPPAVRKRRPRKGGEAS